MDTQKGVNTDVSRKQNEEPGSTVKTLDVIVKGEQMEENEKWMDPKYSSFVQPGSSDQVGLKAGDSGVGRGEGKALYIDHFPTTRRFDELQARLGFDQPSKVLDWLMDAAAPAVTVQEQLHQSKLEQDAYMDPALSPGVGKIDRLNIRESPKDQVKENEKLWRREVESSSSNSIYYEETLANWLQSEELPRDPVEEKSLDLSLSLWVPETGSSTTYSVNGNETLTGWLPRDRAQVTGQEENLSFPMIEERTELRWNSSSSFCSYKRRSYSGSQKTNQIEHLSVGNSASESYASNSTGVGVHRECLNCLLYCGIFPKDYEIDRDTLIQLWMAAGLIVKEPMEDVAAMYFRALERENAISISRKDPSCGKEWYKINHFSLPGVTSSGIRHVRVDAGNPNPLSVNQGEPCHVTVQHSSIDFEELRNFTQMRTLLFLQHHRSCFERIPDNFFRPLKHLETLDLSGTRLLELSSSISHAECLRYLDLSHTLIKQLPETIGCLCSLQTMKLCKCPRLIALPNGITKLNRLRHLEFDTPCSTCFMPPGMGRLTSLRTLLEFPVGADYGCTVRELKNLNDLKGSLCLSKLENVGSLDEAGEANLCRKQCLKKLELRWSPKKRRNTRSDDDIITYLRPHTNLQDFRILCYRGFAFPTWISDPSFASLVNITLFKCENCPLLPSLGLLPSLESLSLYELTALRVIDFHYGQDIAIADVHNVAFPRLQKLEIISMLNLEDMRDPEKCDFPCLVEMTIKDCPKLDTLWKLSSFPSLKYLEINDCRMLPSLPGKDFSIETLVIEGCPLLGSSCSKEGRDSHKIAHIPNVFIDQLDMPSSDSWTREAL